MGGVLRTGKGGHGGSDDVVAVDGARLAAGEDLALGEVGQDVAGAHGEVAPAGGLVAADGDVAAVAAELDLEAVAPNAAAAARVEQQPEPGAALLADPLRDAAALDRGALLGRPPPRRGV